MPLPPWSGPIVRSLRYHLYPFAGNGAWQWNVEQLRRRLYLFNGRKIICIVTGPGLDDPADVYAAFGNDPVEFVTMRNSPLQEAQTWINLWELVHTNDPNEMIFHAHSKGATSWNRGPNVKAGVKLWADAMYSTCLDYLPLIEEILAKYPVVGPFFCQGRGFNSASRWWYAGTFFWVRACEWFRRPWREIEQTWWGSEAFCGRTFRAGEAGKLFTHKGENLYEKVTWDQSVSTDLAAWKETRRNYRAVPFDFTNVDVLVATRHGKPPAGLDYLGKHGAVYLDDTAGWSVAANRLLDAAAERGRDVLFADDDITFGPETFHRLHAFWDRAEIFGFAMTDSHGRPNYIGCDLRQVPPTAAHPWPLAYAQRSFDQTNTPAYVAHVTTSACLIKHNALRAGVRFPAWPGIYHEDRFFMLDAWRRGFRVAYVPGKITHSGGGRAREPDAAGKGALNWRLLHQWMIDHDIPGHCQNGRIPLEGWPL